MHRDLDLQRFTLLLLFRFSDMIINGLEQALNILVLSFVESFQLSAFGVLVNDVWEADATSAFTRRVRADLIELVNRLEAMAQTIRVVGLIVARWT